MWNKHNGDNQQWQIIYVDEWKGYPKKGEMNHDFGMYVERPFYIVSELAKHRYLDVIGRNMVIKTPNGYDTQKWYFDQQSRTIKNVKENKKSFDIASGGRSSNMQVWNKPFFIVSRMPMRRVAEADGSGRMTIKTLVRDRKAQHFVFDGTTKTIKSAQWDNKSLNIQGNGGSNDLYIQPTNARWW